MTTNYHTPWIDDTTEYKAAHMNVPLGELDTQITANVASILANLKKSVHILETVNVDFSSVGETVLHTTVSGETTVPIAAVVRAGGDAGTTQVTIGRSGEVTDFLNTQTLSNVNGDGEMAILQPVPNATPVGLKTYGGGIEIRMNVENADGAAVNLIDILGYRI